jgi:predicted phage terminase large subunit-like protein
VYISVNDVIEATDDIVCSLARGERLRLTWEAERELGKRSTYYLCRNILGYGDLNGKFHVALARYFDRNIRYNQMHLHPRKHFKTTMITIGGNMRLSLIDPNIAIGIIANTLWNSTTFLKEIKAHYIYNDKFRDLYPEHAVKRRRDEGTTERFTTPARTNKTKRSETFECASADKAIVSRHYDKLHFDDPVDDKNSATADLRVKTYDNYATSLATTSLIYGYPYHTIVGTRWAFDDMYQRLIDETQSTKQFKILVTQAEWEEFDARSRRTVKKYLFPEKFPPAALDSLRQRMGKYRYSCMYLNDPVPEGTSTLDFRNVVLFDPDSHKPGPVSRVITVDPAASEDVNEGCPSVVTVSEMDSDAHLYLTAVLRGFWNPEVLIERIIDAALQWGVRRVGVEKVSLSKWLIFYLEKRMKERGVRFEIIPITRDSRISKETRIERVVPFLNDHRLHIRADEPELDMIKREMREFPYGRFKDILDTIADAIELQKRPARGSQVKTYLRLPPRTYSSRTNIQTGYSIRAGSGWEEEGYRKAL